MNVKFRVSNQKLTRTSFEQIVENSNNYLFVEFEFSDDWKDKTKNAYVSQNGSIWFISQIDEKDVVQIPTEVVKSNGFKMYLVARDCQNNVVITTNIVSVNVEKSGNGEGEFPSVKTIESETLELSRTGNIVKIEIPSSYATDEELQNAISDLQDYTDDKFTDYYDKEEIDVIKKAINDDVASKNEELKQTITNESVRLDTKINNEVVNLNTSINGVKSDLNSRMDNLSDSQTKALENEVSNLKNGDTIVGKASNDDLGNEIKSTYANAIESELNTTNYKLNITLKNVLDGVISTTEVDFPTESSVVNLAFNSATNILTFTLRNGNTTQIPLSSIIRGLATEDYVVEKISASENATNEKISAEVSKINTQLGTKVDKVNGKQLSTNDYTNAEKSQVGKIATIETELPNIKGRISTIEAELPTKATQIKASVDSTPIFYNVLGLKLLDKNNQEISSSKVYLPKAQEVLHTSTFIFEEEDSTCRVEGELAGKSREEKMSIFPYNLMREEEVQLQDSNGVDLEGKDKFIVMPNLWLKTIVGEDGTTWSITFANQKVDNDYFRAYDDDSINEVLIAKYKASDDGTHLRSVSGEYPRVNLNQTNADNMLPYYNGKKVDSLDYRVRMLYDLLACCFIENRNVQNVYVGMTSYPWGDANLINQVGEIGKSGSTDSLGKLATGEITTFNETALASGRRPVSILGVENPYGLLWENMSGAVHDSNAKLFLYEGLEHMTPAMMTPSDSNPYYKDVGVTLSTTEGWQKTFTNYKGYFYPKGVGGNSVNGVGDYYWVNLGGWRIFFVGGSWSSGSGCGLFCLFGFFGFGHTGSSIGFRLSLKR